MNTGPRELISCHLPHHVNFARHLQDTPRNRDWSPGGFLNEEIIPRTRGQSGDHLAANDARDHFLPFGQ